MSAKPMAIVYLSLGTNLGNRLAALQAAITGLSPAVSVKKQSPIYETQPWGMIDQPAFLNMVLKGETHLTPQKLLIHLKHLETKMGRIPSIRYGPRLIDMDILFYDDLVLNTPKLTIPHKNLQERAFVLVPLADLEPDLVHPLLGKTILELLNTVDKKGVKPYG
jgi:2-amino-4-hydroxy-6-hydroxymethyldihydropteridine diphosphokinase